MKKFLMTMAALSFVLAAALTGCSRQDRNACYAPTDTGEPCICDPSGGAIREMDAPGPGRAAGRGMRDIEEDLIDFDAAPEPIEKPLTKDANGGKYATVPPTVVVPDEAPAEKKEPEEDFSENAMEQRIKAFESSLKTDPQVVQTIIDEAYDDVPMVQYVPSEAPEAPVAEVPDVAEIAEAAAEEADIAAALVVAEEIEAEVAAEEEAEIAREAAAIVEAVEAELKAEAEVEAELKKALPEIDDFVKDTEDLPIPVSQAAAAEAIDAVEEMEIPDAPAVEELALEEIEEAEEEESTAFLMPPPLYNEPEQEPEAEEEFEPEQQLSLEGFDDADLQFFGDISASLLESDS